MHARFPISAAANPGPQKESSAARGYFPLPTRQAAWSELDGVSLADSRKTRLRRDQLLEAERSRADRRAER
jgi:hypothetical protein